MSLTVVKQPALYSFIGNGIVFEITAASADPVNVIITCNGKEQHAVHYPYESDFEYRARIDISGYITPKTDTIGLPAGSIVGRVPEFEIDYQVKFEGSNYAFNGKAFRGGLSKKIFIQLAQDGTDIFSFRLNTSDKQFLFTTRTHGQTISLRQSEMYSFIFIHPGKDITFISDSGNTIPSAVFAQGAICAMDIGAIYNRFLLSAGEETQTIRVAVDGKIAFRFVILPDIVSEEIHLLRFKNSLGAYETIEVSGEAVHSFEFSEENTYNSLNDFNIYEERRERVLSLDKLEVETGYRTKDELAFILDMIKSDEIYFVYPNEESFRCHVAVDEVKYAYRIKKPTSIPLVVRAVFSESFVSPGMGFGVRVLASEKEEIICTEDSKNAIKI